MLSTVQWDTYLKAKLQAVWICLNHYCEPLLCPSDSEMTTSQTERGTYTGM